MLRNIHEVIKTEDGMFKVRLSCGHMGQTLLKYKPSMSKIYECERCDVKGQGVKKIIGHLNNKH